MDTHTIRIEVPTWIVEEIEKLTKEGWTINLDAICADAITDVINPSNRMKILKIQDDLSAMNAKLVYIRFKTEKEEEGDEQASIFV